MKDKGKYAMKKDILLTEDILAAIEKYGGFRKLLNRLEAFEFSENAQPLAWLTDESVRCLRRGGNGSRATAPAHASQSKIAKHPLYIGRAPSNG